MHVRNVLLGQRWLRVIFFPVRCPVTERREELFRWLLGNLLLGDVGSVYLSGSRAESLDCSSEGWIAPPPLGRKECMCMLMFQWHTKT